MLTDIKIKNAKPRDMKYKLYDERGLSLLITPAGGKLWRFKFDFNGKEQTLTLRSYPDVSLAEAREKRDAARKLVAHGVDPREIRKAQKAAKDKSENSFEVVAREWHEKYTPTWSASHADTIIKRLIRDVFPWMGARPISEIKASDVLAVMRRVESRGALETAHRIKTICGQVFRYAVSTDRAERDTTGDLKGALPPAKETHRAAITDPKQAADLLRAIDGYQGSFVTRCALRLAPQVFVRPGELRQAEWVEIDFDAAEWNIPAERMKMNEPLIVPLSRQALEILREIKPLTGNGRYLFPSIRTSTRPMSNNAILSALRRMDYSKDVMSGHGFRAMARTMLAERLLVPTEYIELQLAHAVMGPNGRAYNRVAFLKERREMMQLWSDYLDGLKAGAKI